MARRTTIIERCPYIPGTDIGVYQRKEHEEIGFFLGQVRHELLEYVEEGGSLDLQQAERVFQQFRGELEEHIHSEEGKIFPSWTQSHPGDQRLIDLFLQQHQNIRVLVARVDVWLKNPGPGSPRTNRARGLPLVDALRDALQGHEQGEERLWPVKPRVGVERMAVPKSTRAPRKRRPAAQERRERDALRADLARGRPSTSPRALTAGENAARRGEVWSDYKNRYVPVDEYFTSDQAAVYYRGMGLDRGGRIVPPAVPEVPWDGPKPLGSRFERLRTPLSAHTPVGRKAVYQGVLAHAQQVAEGQARHISTFRLHARDHVQLGHPRDTRGNDASIEITLGPKEITIRPETVSILTEDVTLAGKTADEAVRQVNAWVDHFAAKRSYWTRGLPTDRGEARAASNAGGPPSERDVYYASQDDPLAVLPPWLSFPDGSRLHVDAEDTASTARVGHYAAAFAAKRHYRVGRRFGVYDDRGEGRRYVVQAGGVQALAPNGRPQGPVYSGEYVERMPGGRKQPGLADLRARWANAFGSRDAAQANLPLPTQMREVAWELGYEHAQNGQDPYERVLGRFEPLAESYGVNLHAEFSRGFQENGGVESRVSVLSTKGTHLASGRPRR